MCFWHRFSRASASLVIITPESTPTFQVFAALGSTKSECPVNLVAIDMEPNKWDWSLLGEYRENRENEHSM
jgi:hypothetical protein